MSIIDPKYFPVFKQSKLIANYKKIREKINYTYRFLIDSDTIPSANCDYSEIYPTNIILLYVKSFPDKGFVNLGINNQTPARIKVFAQNYNILRIMSGMGGLSYLS